MRFEFPTIGPFRHPVDSMNRGRGLALDITDFGTDEGIEVTIYAKGSGQILFETILADPESRVLLTHGTAETEAFWQCLHTQASVGHEHHLFLTARCRFSLLTPAISTRRMGHAEIRNVEFLRLIEVLLDELQTREPGMPVELAVTHRNPAFAGVINF